MLRAIVLGFVLLTLSGPLFGQDDAVIINPDSLNLPEPPREGFFKKGYPDPLKAGIMSLVIPGAGQVYNKSWWKVPLVYGALGGMAYLIRYNNEQYRRLETAYQANLRDEPHEFTGTAIDNPTSLRNIRDSFDKNRQLSWVGFIAVYLLNGVEAFVDAHLQNFNISDDLSLRIEPQFDLMPGPGSPQPVVGLGVGIPLQSR